MSRCPIRYIHGNLLFDHTGRAGAVYRLPTKSYSLLPDNEKWALNLVMCGLALRAKADFSILRVNRRHPTDEYVPQGMDFVDTRHQDTGTWQEFLTQHEPRIRQLGSHEPEVYWRVSMEKPTNQWAVARSIDRAAHRISEAFGVGAEIPISQRELRGLLDRQNLVLNRAQDTIAEIRPASMRELQWLCQRNAVALVDEPRMDPWWLPDALVTHIDGEGAAFKPMPGDIRRLFSASITREKDHLAVVAEGRSGTVTSYQAFLTVGMLPHQGITFPGLTAELMFAPLDGLDFPVDAVAHFEWVTNQRALAEIRRRLRNAEDRIKEAMKAARTPDDRTLLTPSLARDLEQILLHESKPPMFDVSVLYRVAAPSLDELVRRVDMTREQFPGVSVHLPPGEQERLYDAHLPHAAHVYTDWQQRMTLDQMGMLMPIAGRQVGDRRGVYFAYTARGRAMNPVKIDPGRPGRDATPDTWYVAGRQGSGKTVAAMTIGAHAAMRGSTVLTADPGNDHFITRLPEFDGESAIVSLSAEQESDRGMLDPLVAAPREVQETVALSYYVDLLPDIDVAGRRALMNAIKVARKEHTGSLGAINMLLDGDAVEQEVGRNLQLFSDFGLGRLGFSDGSPFDRGQIARITTFTMANLGLPSASMKREMYDDRQRMAVATFKLLGAHLMGIVTRDRSDHKVVILDEAWVFDGPDGQALLDQFVRLARKNNATVIICSQTISDLGEVKKLIGIYLIGGVNNVEEAAAALKLIGLDHEDEGLCAQLADKHTFCKGLMLFRDTEGRVEVVQIDPVIPHWLATFDTTPKTPAPETWRADTSRSQTPTRGLRS